MRPHAPALACALHDAEPLVRGHAAWAIAQIGAQEGASILHAARASETDPDVLDEIDLALADLDGTSDR